MPLEARFGGIFVRDRPAADEPQDHRLYMSRVFHGGAALANQLSAVPFVIKERKDLLGVRPRYRRSVP